MSWLAVLVCLQMPIAMVMGVYLLSLVFDRVDDYPNWAINAAAFIMVSILFAFTIPALYLAIETLK